MVSEGDLFSQALACIQSHDINGAKRCYHRLIRMDPRFMEAHLNLGVIYFEEKQYDLAKSHFEAAIAINPNYAMAHFNLGNIYEETYSQVKAVECYRRALSIFPAYADCHYNLAITYEELGNLSGALRHWQEYLRYDKAGKWADHARKRRHALLRVPNMPKLVVSNATPQRTPERVQLTLV